MRNDSSTNGGLQIHMQKNETGPLLDIMTKKINERPNYRTKYKAAQRNHASRSLGNGLFTITPKEQATE